MTYALLIYRNLPASPPLSPDEERAALVRHRALQTEAAARGELYSVARLDDPHSARSVRPTASAHEVTDGPFIETKEWLVGFYVIDCETEAQAIERARLLCPDLSHGIEVRPVTWQWKP